MPYVSPTHSGPGFKAELSPKQMAAFRKRVERWRGAPLAKRASEGNFKAAQYMASVMKRSAPRSKAAAARRTSGKPGTLRKSIKARRGRRGIIKNAYAGPTAPHSFLVTRGTGQHSLAPVRSGKSNIQLLPPTYGKAGRKRAVGVGNVNVRTGSGMTHPGAKPNPFVDEATAHHHAVAVRIINQMLFSE